MNCIQTDLFRIEREKIFHQIGPWMMTFTAKRIIKIVSEYFSRKLDRFPKINLFSNLIR